MKLGLTWYNRWLDINEKGVIIDCLIHYIENVFVKGLLRTALESHKYPSSLVPRWDQEGGAKCKFYSTEPNEICT